MKVVSPLAYTPSPSELAALWRYAPELAYTVVIAQQRGK